MDTTIEIPAREVRVGDRIPYRHRGNPCNGIAAWLHVVAPWSAGAFRVVADGEGEAPFVVDGGELVEVDRSGSAS